MGDAEWVNGVNLLDIKDELTLHEMLDRSEDYEDRKKVRSRLKDVIADSRAKREAMIAHREADREEILRARVRDADENKRRTLAMYDAMAKSAPAGGNKVMDVNILREGRSSTPSTPGAPEQGPRVDLVEQAIRQRQADADDRKKRTLMAYDNAAKSGPAGAARFIDFDAVIKKEDLQNYDPNQKNTKRSTFQMFGGVPIAAPAGAQAPLKPMAEQPRDIMEEAIRKRQAESDARKARTLAAYDKAARSRPAGVPVTVYIPQEGDMEPVVDVVSRSQRGMITTPVSPPPAHRSSAASSSPLTPHRAFAPTVQPVYRQFAPTPPGSPQQQPRFQTQIQFQPPTAIKPAAPVAQPVYQQQFANAPPGSPYQQPRHQNQFPSPPPPPPPPPKPAASFAQPTYQQQFSNTPPGSPQTQQRYQSQLQFQPQPPARPQPQPPPPPPPSQQYIPPYQNQSYPEQGYTTPFQPQRHPPVTNNVYPTPAYQSQHPSFQVDNGYAQPSYQSQQPSRDHAYTPPGFQNQPQPRMAPSQYYSDTPSQQSRVIPVQIYNNTDEAPSTQASRYYYRPQGQQITITGPSKTSPSFTVPQAQQQRYGQQQQSNQQRPQQPAARPQPQQPAARPQPQPVQRPPQQQQQQTVQQRQQQQSQQQTSSATFKLGGTQKTTTTTTTVSSKQQYYDDEDEEEEEEEEESE